MVNKDLHKCSTNYNKSGTPFHLLVILLCSFRLLASSLTPSERCKSPRSHFSTQKCTNIVVGYWGVTSLSRPPRWPGNERIRRRRGNQKAPKGKDARSQEINGVLSSYLACLTSVDLRQTNRVMLSRLDTPGKGRGPRWLHDVTITMSKHHLRWQVKFK